MNQAHRTRSIAHFCPPRRAKDYEANWDNIVAEAKAAVAGLDGEDEEDGEEEGEGQQPGTSQQQQQSEREGACAPSSSGGSLAGAGSQGAAAVEGGMLELEGCEGGRPEAQTQRAQQVRFQGSFSICGCSCGV